MMEEFELIMTDDLEYDTRLYRYLSLSQFIEFIEKRKIYLTDINHWEDTWEIPIKDNKIDNSVLNDKNRITYSKNLLGQSWSLLGVSDALWRIYSNESEGIMIKTTVGKFKLIKGIKKAMIAPVIYYDNLDKILNDIKDIKGYDNIFGAGFLKRKAFEHEKEVRLVTINEDQYIESYEEDFKHILLDINPEDFIEEIIIDPRAVNWYVDTIKLYCKRAGLNVVPIKSDLYEKI